MNDIIMSPIRLKELESLIQNSVERAFRAEGIINPQKVQSDQDLLTIQEAAHFLSLTVPTIYSKVSKRELPFMKKGRRLYFSRAELMNYLKTGRVKTHQESLDEAHLHLKPKKKGGVSHE